ncbi:MAG: zinc permease, partial [Chloroflexi bacterium]
MSTGQILALGAIAGFTVFLGLPMGRIRSASPRV